MLFIYREAYYEQNKMPIKKGEEDGTSPRGWTPGRTTWRPSIIRPR